MADDALDVAREAVRRRAWGEAADAFDLVSEQQPIGPDDLRDMELRSIFSSCHGVEVNHAGDGFFVDFDSPRDAVEAGVRIQRRLAEHRQDHGYAPSVRIGIHTGAATMDGADFRGREVHLAARVGSAAGPDEVLVTAATLDTAGPLRYPVDDGRAAALKGISEPVKLHGVDWR